MFFLGAAVIGGWVISDWPGLAKSKLYESRDLKPTMDMRSLFKSILHDHLHVASGPLGKTIFPDSSQAKMIPDLFTG